MQIDHLDHLVLTVADPETTIEFYTTVLGMTAHTFGNNRRALLFGVSKINLHEAGREIDPKAQHPAPGSADLCLIVKDPIDEVLRQLTDHQVPVELGPVTRTGAQGPIDSIYIRDPDRNLIELSNYIAPPSADRIETPASL
ncbi:VOC family protein [Rhodococcus sp. T2V]|nr:VOC family protein [Rhodococcus sp. T2V]